MLMIASMKDLRTISSEGECSSTIWDGNLWTATQIFNQELSKMRAPLGSWRLLFVNDGRPRQEALQQIYRARSSFRDGQDLEDHVDSASFQAARVLIRFVRQFGSSGCRQ
jgi:hypothetical protein